MRFRPRGEYVVLRKVETKPKGSIIIPKAKFESKKGPQPQSRDWPVEDCLYKVLEVGPGSHTLTGERLEVNLSPGDVVLSTGHLPKLEGFPGLHICVADMLACVVEGAEIQTETPQAIAA